MEDSKTENETAEEVKRMLISNYSFIDPNDVRITHDTSSYHPGTARQASNGSCFVLVSAPEVPRIKSDTFYQANPHRRKPSEEEVERAEQTVEMIENACRTVSGMFEESEFVPVSEHEGYDSSQGNEQYMNIRIQ